MTDSTTYDKITPRTQHFKSAYQENFAGPDAFEQPTGFGSDAQLSWTNSAHGTKNPQWRHYVAIHANAGTNFNASRYEYTLTPGFMDFRANLSPVLDPEFRTRYVSSGLATPYPPSAFNAGGVPVGSAANDAAGAWYSNVRDAMSTFKGSTFAAEANEARHMMYDRATKMLSLIPPFQSRLRKRWNTRRTKKGKLKTLADSWLELQFGWLPLASDISDAASALNNPQLEVVHVSSGWKRNSADDPNYFGDSVGGIGIGQVIRETRARTEYAVRYIGQVYARSLGQASAVQDFGLGVREFFPTIYEVIPWSFAVDYFTNLGKIINAVSYASVDVAWVNMQIQESRTITHTVRGSISPLFVLYDKNQAINIPSQAISKAISYTRIATGVSVPVPGLTFKLPSLKQGLNLAALAVSRRLRLSF